MEARADYDLIVAGGGPAGCACAITAARTGVRVLLLEKDHFPRHKVCGEFVSPESLGVLSSLLGPDCFSRRPEITVARIFLDKKAISLPISPPALSIPRFDLDAALLDSARRSGVCVHEGTAVHQVESMPSGRFAVSTREGIFTARTAVNAAGRWSQLTPNRIPVQDKWIGLKAHFYEDKPSPSVDLYFFPGGYCGVQRVADNAVNAAAMVRAETASSMDQVLAAHPELWQRSRCWEPVFPPITTSPLYFRAPLTEHRGIMLVGDAAAFIDPFAGDGISLALQSGKVAAESLAGVWRGSFLLEIAHRHYRAEYRKRFAPAFRYAARLRRFLASPSWVRSPLLRLMEKRLVAAFIVRRTRAH